MKPIPPMSKEERLKRKAKLQNTKAIEAKKKLGPPENRVSLSGSSYLGSDPGEWLYADGVGWYHASECEWFSSVYRRCIVDGLYHLGNRMVRTKKNDEYIHMSHVGRGWELCHQSGRACRIEEMERVYDRTGVARYAYRSYIEGTDYYRVCDFSHKLYDANCLLFYKNPITPMWKVVAKPECKLNPTIFQVCPRCGNYAERAGIKNRPELGETCCNDCYVDTVLKNIIHVHNFDGYPKILSSNPTVRLLVKGKLTQVADDTHRLYGVECEVEIDDKCKLTRWELAVNATKALGKDFIVHKNDGSLRLHHRESPLWGFEMVSAPADMATHRERWPKIEAMEGFKFLRAWDTTTCGMHVHVGKASLTTLQVGRIMVFITNPENRKFIELVAGRNSAASSRFIDKGYTDGDKPDPDKYCAVNIRPAHTIEFRIFRGTIHPAHILRNIEFCDAVCSFCHPSSRSLQEVKSWKAFVLYCRVRRREYPEFTRWLELKKLIPDSRLAPGVTKPEVPEGELVEKKSQDKWY